MIAHLPDGRVWVLVPSAASVTRWRVRTREGAATFLEAMVLAE